MRVGELIDELQDSGYAASRTHFSPTSIKTNAPFEEVLDALKGRTAGG